MRVAIIGAGLSGMACAFELKKYGITPIIFEKRDKIGEVLEYSTLMLNMLSRNIRNPVKYFRKEFGLNITPLFPLKKITLHSPNHKKTMVGNHGYVFMRGQEKNSLENQVALQAGLPVIFTTPVDIDQIKNDFDRIVVATGDDFIASRLGVWETTFTAITRVAFLLGDFETMSVDAWFDTRFAKNAFVYLIPESPQKAKLSMIINNISFHETDYYWKEFLSLQPLPYKVIETRDMEHKTGFAYPVQTDNIYLVGNSAGMTDSFIGLGSRKAIQSGILAARCIAEGLDYNQLMKPLMNEIRIYNEFRNALSTMDNKGLDLIISILGFPVVKQLIYNNPFFKLACGDFFIKAYNRHIGQKYRLFSKERL